MRISISSHDWVAPVFVLLLLVFVLLIWRFNPRDRLEKAFSCSEPFQGNCYECIVIGISFSDGGAICSIGANAFGIYMSRPPHLTTNPWALSWKFGPNVPETLRTPILIPWKDLRYYKTRVVFKKYMRFDLAVLKIHFILPLPVAESLLSDAGREIPI